MAGGIVLASLVCLLNAWNRDFWAPEEPDFAAVVKEMERRTEGGERWAFLFPTLGGELYAEKPPLLYWCALLSRALTGADPRLSYRFPAAFAAALSLAVTYLAGRRFLNGRVAAAGCLVQGTSYLHLWCGSWLLTDMLFASFVALSVVAFGIALLWEPRSWRWSVVGWVGLALASLSKSALLAPVLVLGPILLFVLTKPGGPGIRQELLGLRPLWGLGIVLGLVAPWYLVLLFAEGGEFFREHVLEQHLLRLLDADSHARPFWHYLKTLAADFLPWSPFIPLLVFHGKSRFRRHGKRFFAVWALWTFVVLSLVSSKQGKYLLPMWPALSLLAAAALLEEERESIWEGFLGDWVFRGVSWALRVPLPVVVFLGLFWATGFHHRIGLDQEVVGALDRTGTVLSWIAILLLASGALFAAGVGIARRLGEDGAALPLAYLGAAMLIVQAAGTFTFADLNEVKSARALCRAAEETAGKRPLAIYGRNRGAVHYYLERDLLHLPRLDPLRAGSPQEEKLDAYLASPEEVFLIIGEEDLEKLRAEFPKYRERLRVVRDGLRFGFHRRALIASNAKAGRG